MSMIGQTIAHYTINEKIGEGGMGEVYRATDTKLKRDVALKVLPESFTQNAQRVARFRREAEVLASLNHSNIGAIYGLEESGTSQVLVLELIEGDTLEERIAEGAIPLEEALKIALQIAEALEAAHEKGVIHRDVKPANVKITPEGQVKVLDFGLAKAIDEGPTTTDLSQSPTLTMQATQAGMILGTAGYMSPEQARAKPTDSRTDIWAFGAVVFELLSGKPAFDGEDFSMVLASVLKHDLKWKRMPARTPRAIRRLIERCLTPELRNRFQAIGDARFEIERYLSDPSESETRGVITGNAQPTWLSRLPWGIALISLVLVLFLWSPWETPPEPEVTKLSLDVPLSLPIGRAGAALAIAPDGKSIVYWTPEDDGLYLQRLDQIGLVRLPDTEGARNPFFSPDGEWIAFTVPGDSLKIISIRGGHPQTLCPIGSNPYGGSWSEKGTIVFSGSNTGLFRIPATGGEPEVVTRLEAGEQGHRWPAFLPGGETVLMTRRTQGPSFQETRIELVQLVDGRRQVLQGEGAYHGQYASGHFVFMRDTTLFAAPFDLKSRTQTGPPVPVLQNVLGSVGNLGVGQYAFSARGILIYQSNSTEARENLLVRFSRKGDATPLAGGPGSCLEVSLSPDGRRLAVTISDGRKDDIWIDDLQEGTRSRLTFDPSGSFHPVWDGEFIIFSSSRTGRVELFRRRFDAASELEQLTEGSLSPIAGSVSPDGSVLVLSHLSGGDRNIAILDLQKKTAPTNILADEFGERSPKISPDGNWLAYESDETGASEIFVRPFPAGPGKRQISNGGGAFPLWSSQGSELFFHRDGTIYAVPYRTERQSFRHTRPQALFTLSIGAPAYHLMPHWIDVAPDAQSFVAVQPSRPERKRSQVVLVLNWFDELKRLVSEGN